MDGQLTWLWIQAVSKFGANRTARVPGRIIFLIVLIHTIKGIKTAGVPRSWIQIPKMHPHWDVGNDPGSLLSSQRCVNI